MSSVDIVGDDVLGHQLIAALLDGLFPIDVLLLQHFLQDLEAALLAAAVVLRVEVDKPAHVDHAVGEDLDAAAADIDDSLVDAAVGDFVGLRPGEDLAGHGQHLAGHGIGDGIGQGLVRQTGPDIHLLIELVAADLGNVVAAGIEEQRGQIALGVLHRRGFARAQTAVDLQQGLLAAVAGVLLEGRQDALVLAEEFLDLGVGGDAQGADQAGDGKLAVLVDAHKEGVLVIGLVFQPRAAVRNDLRGVGVLIGLVHLMTVVHAGAADDLRDDDALGAVDDEGAAVGHHGEIAHEDGLLLDLAGVLLQELHPHFDGLGIGGVALLALLHGVLRALVHGEVLEGQLQVAGVVGDGADVAEDLLEPFVQEPVVGILLDLEQIGHFEDFFILREAVAQGLAKENFLRLCH